MIQTGGQTLEHELTFLFDDFIASQNYNTHR